MNPMWFVLEAIKKGAYADMEMRQSVGMPFKTHIYLDVREEGVEFSVCDNMLIKPGHEPEPPPPGESMPGASLTADDYEPGVSISFWKNGEIDLMLALDMDRAVDFVGELLSLIRTITDRGLEMEREKTETNSPDGQRGL